MKKSVGHQCCLVLLMVIVSVSGAVAKAAVQEQPTGVDTTSYTNRIVREGIAIEFQMQSLDPEKQAQRTFQEGDTVTFRFAITDTTTGTPLSGIYPAAWMDLRPEDEKTDPDICQTKVKNFVGGSLLSQPELDLNVYYVLALNNDATISVVDPLFGFGTTKLLDLVLLQSPAEDWVLTPDQMRLFVSMPESDRVAVVDTASWEVVANFDVGPRPSRVALQPDGKYLWVGYDTPKTSAQQSGVTVIDTEGLTVVKDLPTGTGHHEIALSDDNRYAFVTNEEAGTLSVIDIRTLRKIKDVRTGRRPVSIAFSAISQAVYVVHQADGTIVAVDVKRHEVIARMQAEPGLGQIKFAPGGGWRLGFVVNPEQDLVHILDVSVNRIIQTGAVEDGPDQLAFSDQLAYVRRRNSETVLMIPLDQVGSEGQSVPVVDFPGGRIPFGRVSRPSPADGIVQAPGATAVLVANPADRAIYFYKEGMAAPMGHFQNDGREPRAVLVVDRSLQERAPGTYETIATLRRPGLYDVAFFLDSPRTIHCFEVRVAPNPARQAERATLRPVVIEPLIASCVLPVGERETTVSVYRGLQPPPPGRVSVEPAGVLSLRGPERPGAGAGYLRRPATGRARPCRAAPPNVAIIYTP